MSNYNKSNRNIKKDYNNPKNINIAICKKCRGKCCRRSGCYFSPDDFEEISFGYLKSEIEKGYISIYLQDGGQFYHDTYILKVRDRDVPIVDNGYRIVQSPCILLTEQGCKLSYKERPTGGKLYIPQYDNGFYNCHTNYTIRDCCNEWVPYQELLTKLVQYFSSKNIPCVI